jgi:PAS domain S-box-containing protein
MKDYLRYFYAVLAIPVVILTRFALIPLTGQGTPFITLFPATVIIALLGGMGPAILTGVLGVLISDYFFIPPLHSWDLGIEFLSRTAVVVLTSVFVGYVGAMLRQARSGAEKQAVEINRSREDLKRAQAVALTGSWRLDVRKDVLNWSDEAYRIFGVPAGTALTYESFLSYIHPDDRDAVDEKWKTALNGEKYDVEHRIVVNGQIKWVHEKAELEYEKDGTLSGGFGTVTDITERKKREEELYRLNRTLRALSNSTQAMMRVKDESDYIQEVCDIIVKDCGHKMVWVGFAENDQAKSVRPVAYSGFEKGYLETLKITWADTERGRGPTGTAIRTGKASLCRNMPTDNAFKPWRAQALERGYASSISLPLMSGQTAFGALTIYSTQMDPFSHDEIDLLTELTSDLSYGISAIRFRTARDEAQKALIESEKKYRELVQYANSAIVRWNPSGEITLFNEYAQKFFGYSADEVLGKKVDILLPQGQSEEADPWELIQDIVNDPQRYANNINENVCKDGRRVWMAWTNKPIYDENGRVSELLAVGTDITKQKQAEEITSRQNAVLDGINKILNAALTCETEEQLGSICLTVAEGVTQSKFGFVGEVNADGKLDDIAISDPGWSSCKMLIPEGHTGYRIAPSGFAIHGIYSRVISEGKGFFTNDPQSHPDSIGFPEGHPALKAFLGVPLIYKNETIGMVAVGNRQGGYHREQLESLETLATAIAQAFMQHKAELEVRQSRDELEVRVKERTAQLDRTVSQLQRQVKQRIQAEQTATAERQRFNDVLETLPAYICLLTPDYYMPFANKVFRDLFGYYPDKKCYEFLFNRPEPCENSETYKVLENNEPQHWEWTGPNGRDYDIYDFPFKDTDGSQLILEMGIDVTERKRAEAAVQAASRYARGLLEASLDPLVTISQEGKITDVNEATIRVTGVSREQLVGTDFSNYFTEAAKAEEGYQRVFAKGFVTDYPLTIRHRDGHLTDVLYNATVYKNTQGEVVGVFAAARDVTEKKLAEERQGTTNSLLELYARKTSRKDYLNAAVDVIRNWSGCSRVGIRIKDDKDNIPYESFVGFENDFVAMENPLNLNKDSCLCIRAILQKPISNDKALLTPGGSFYSNDSRAFVKKLSPEQAKDYRGQCMKHGFQAIGIIPIRYRGDVLGAIHIADTEKDMVPFANIQFIESTIAPLVGEAINRFNAEAELEKYRLHLEDLVKQRTEELARSNKDLEQFAYVASHDLQEPLRAVSGFVSLLEHQLQESLNAKTKEYMNFTVDGVTRMQSLINGLLEYSRIDTRGKPPESTDSGKSLADAILSLQASIKETGAKITSDKLPTINIDPVQLSQLFQNLISNAIKFRSDLRPEIHVGADHQNNAWRFAVKDNGIGIEPQYAERIFMIFQRLHTRKKYPGTGIGLSLCKKIVERHGGKIWVESEPGKGSTFYFTVPDMEGAQ